MDDRTRAAGGGVVEFAVIGEDPRTPQLAPRADARLLAARAGARRVALGLAVSDAGRLLAVAPAELTALEEGAPVDRPALASRLAAFAALTDDSAYATTDYLTLGALGVRLAAAARSVGDVAESSESLRLVIQASDDFAALVTMADQQFFLAEPCPTADPRLDALLAALGVHLCRAAGLPATGEWTRHPSRYLDSFWRFPAAHGALEAFKYQRTPSCFRARGIIFNADNLVSV